MKKIIKNIELPKTSKKQLAKKFKMSKVKPHPNEKYSELSTLKVGDVLQVSGVKYQTIRRSLLRAKYKYGYEFYGTDIRSGVRIWRTA